MPSAEISKRVTSWFSALQIARHSLYTQVEKVLTSFHRGVARRSNPATAKRMEFTPDDDASSASSSAVVTLLGNRGEDGAPLLEIVILDLSLTRL